MKLLNQLMAVALIAVAPVSAQAGKHDNPKEFIQDLGAKAIASLTDSKVSLAQRKNHFGQLLDQAFDVPSIASFVLGRYWRLATPEERKEYVGLFRAMLIEAYASKFEGYNDIKIVVVNTRGDEKDGFMVSTTIHVPDMAELKLDWKVFPSETGFKILDVVIDNVSMSITQRSEFASIIQGNNGSIRAFIDVLRQKISDLEANPPVGRQQG